MAGCASQPKIVNQFGDAASTTVKAENAYYDALDQRMALRFEVCMLGHKEVDISDTGVLNGVSKNKDDLGCIDPMFPPDSKLVPADVRKALNAVFDAIEKYGASLQALIGDNPTADFDKNVDSLGKSLQGFDKNVLTKLRVKGPTDAELNAAGQAVKFIGDVLIKYAVDKDVKEAATKAQQPLKDIVNVVEKVNSYWQPFAASLAREDGNRIIELWRHETVTGRKALYDEWAKSRAPVTVLLQFWSGLCRPLEARISGSDLK
jgi:hypothetical protein